MPESPETIPDPSRPSFLKRWLGWRILALTVVVLILLSPVLYRGRRLGQVPVIDDPFDVKELEAKHVSDEENAAILLLEATEKLVDVSQIEKSVYIDQSIDGWDPGDATLDRYLKANQPALEIWRAAADRPDFQTNADGADLSSLIDLNRFAAWQIEKFVATGDPHAAIPWIEAMMQNAHLIRRNSSEVDSLKGVAFFAVSANLTNDWSAHPTVCREDIERVMKLLDKARLLKPPLSENVKHGYLDSKEFYRNWDFQEYITFYNQSNTKPPLKYRWQSWIEAEPEYTLRLLPLITTNHLQFIDKPRRERPPLISGDIFDGSSFNPATQRELPASELADLLFQSRLINAVRFSLLVGPLYSFDRDEARYRCLTVALAAQACFRDRGEFPEKAAELVPEYLDEIPDDLYSPAPAPLLYRRDGNGAVVYSRYKNELDDGGAVVDYDEKTTPGDLLDLGYRIRNPFDRPLRAPKP